MRGHGLRLVPLAALTGLTVVTAAALVAAGHVLPAPPAQPGRWYGWWETTGPVMAVFATARLVLVGLLSAWGAVLVAATVLAAGRRAHRPGWAGSAPRPVLRLALLLSASGAPLAACGAAAAQSGAAVPPPPVLYRVTPSAGPTPAAPARTAAPTHKPAAARAATPAPAAGPIDPATPARSRRPAGPARWTRAAAPRPAAPPPAATGPAPSSTPRPGQPWLVQPGDDLWNLAARALDSAPAGADRPAVATYWLQVIAANRDRLPDPADPSLLFPGDTVVLPAL